jgi:hypothetical protein
VSILERDCVALLARIDCASEFDNSSAERAVGRLDDKRQFGGNFGDASPLAVRLG